MVWGDPDQETWEASLRGEIALAGCVIESDEKGSIPQNKCLSCGYCWMSDENT
jgi:hypothetical protein